MSAEPFIQVNEQRLPWRDGEHVAALLERLGTPPEAVATALNGCFVARAQRAATPLAPGDVLTVFRPIGGG
jgi:sulfur carrier protein